MSVSLIVAAVVALAFWLDRLMLREGHPTPDTVIVVNLASYKATHRIRRHAKPLYPRPIKSSRDYPRPMGAA